MQGEMDNEIWIGGSLLVFVQALITELKKKKKTKEIFELIESNL